MSINYIKQNLDKFDDDNLISFLFDIITIGGLDSVEDFDDTKIYKENEKVYYKDLDGMHHIYKCKVEESTVGVIHRDEWIDLLQSFRKTIVHPDSIVSSVEILEEVVFSESANQTRFELTTTGVADKMYDVIVFHPDLGRLAKTDYDISGQFVILKPGYEVSSAGKRMIFDLYRMM